MKANQIRNSSNQAIVGLYENEITEGDIMRFSSEEPGHEQIYVLNTAQAGGYRIELPFHYQQGNNQLDAFLLDAATGTWAMIARYSSLVTALAGDPGPQVTTPISPSKNFEELTSNTVKVTGCIATQTVMFKIPKTSTPGQFNAKVVVNETGDDIGIDLLGPGAAIRWRDTDGRVFLVRMSAGTLVAQEE